MCWSLPQMFVASVLMMTPWFACIESLKGLNEFERQGFGPWFTLRPLGSTSCASAMAATSTLPGSTYTTPLLLPEPLA
jgi:hypothetical protein